MLKNYIKIAFRSLIANRLFSTINILSLTIGMSAALLIFIWVHNELSFDQYHSDSERIYRIVSHVDVGEEIWKWGMVSLPAAGFMMEEIPEIEEVALLRAAFEPVIVKIGAKELFEEKDFAYVEPKWFKLFNYTVLEGSLELFSTNIHSLALTESLAKKYFGNQSVIGKKVEIDSTNYVVAALLADNPSNSSFQFEAYAPFLAQFSAEDTFEDNRTNWGNFNYMAFLKASKNTVSSKISDKITNIFDANRENNNASISLEAISNIRFNQGFQSDSLKHQNKMAVYIFAFIGLLILLTAALNYINLSTALMSKRVREIGIKKIVGASSKHIFTQIVLETLLVSILAFTIALGIAYISIPFLNNYVEIPLQIAFDKPQIWIALVGLISISILLSGFYPALLFSNFKPIRLLTGMKFTKEGISLRKALVITQFVLSITVLISTLVIYQQLQFIQNKDVGYNRSHIIEISPNLYQGDWEKNFERFALFEYELQQTPEFESIAVTGESLINVKSSNGGNFSWEGKAPDYKAVVATFSANEKLSDVFDLKMKDGRWFSVEYSDDVNNIIINETAVKTFNIPQPVVGQKVKFQEEGQIIGVVKDFNFKSPREKIQPLLINHNGDWGGTILAKVNPQNTKDALAKAEEKFIEIFPELPFKYTFLDDNYQKMHENETKISLLFQISTVLLIFISCLGLFGLATFNVERRTKEIGIRKVLGANVRVIVQLLSKDFLQLVLIAIFLATPIAWYVMQKWLENYAYHIDLKWWMFAISGVVAISIALLTVSFQSVRAALANPIESLRNE